MSAINIADPSLHLLIPPFSVHLAQYPLDTPIPPQLFDSNLPFLSVTKAPGEITVLYGVDKAGSGAEDWPSTVGLPEPIAKDGPYAVLRVCGPLDLTLTGILNELTTPLREASVPIYAVSTWDTDYVLVPSAKLDAAIEALTGAGWTFDR